MPTVIDALVVTLGLDPADFDAGQKKAAADLLKTKQNANSTAKEIQASGKVAATFFTQLRNEALGFFAVMLGTRSLMGFAEQVTGADAAVGRLSARTGVSTQNISMFQNMVQEMGGTAEDANGAVSGLADALAKFKLGDPEALRGLQMMGVQIDPNATPDKVLDQIHQRIGVLRKQGRPENVINAMVTSVPGINQNMANLLEAPDAQYQAARRRAQANGLINPNDARQAEELQRTIADLRQSFTSLGRAIVTDFAPYVTQAVDKMTAWMNANRGWLEQKIGEAIQKLGEWLKGINWQQLGTDLTGFAASADAVAKALGGWTPVLEGLAALWATSKVASMFSGILMLGRLVGGTAAAGVGLVGGATAAVMATTAAAALVAMSGQTGEAPGIMTPLQQRVAFGKSNEFMQAMMKAGYSREAAAGVAGNIASESGFRTDIHDSVTGTHWGLAQWSPERRAAIMKHFGASDWSQVDQTQALLWEISPTGPYAMTGDALRQVDKGVTGSKQAAVITDQFYEKPGDYAVNDRRRATYAERIYSNAYGNTGPADPGLRASPRAQGTAAPAPVAQSSQTSINGPITIHTQAKDAHGIAASLQTALKQRVGAFDYGLA